MSDVKLPALQILKAAPQHADELGSSGLAMLMAICGQWDSLGCSRAVCWSNSRLAERCGLSRNSIAKVRSKLIETGWLIYLPDGRKSGHYTPKLPEWFAQSSAVECANGVQLSVQTVCKQSAVDCAITVQMRVTYIPIPNPIPTPTPPPNTQTSSSGGGGGGDILGKISARIPLDMPRLYLGIGKGEQSRKDTVAYIALLAKTINPDQPDYNRAYRALRSWYHDTVAAMADPKAMVFITEAIADTDLDKIASSHKEKP